MALLALTAAPPIGDGLHPARAQEGAPAATDPKPGYLTVREAIRRTDPKPAESLVRTSATAAQPPQAPGPNRASDLPPALVDVASPPIQERARAADAPLPADPEAASLDAMNANARPLSLPDAITLAYRTQPRLRAQLESIEQARGHEGIAFSAFLPVAGGSYRAGGIDLHTGASRPSSGTGTGSNYTVLPSAGVLPGGLVIASAFEFAEFQVQWLVLDFGRRLGVYEQARLAGDIAQLQTSRAMQTVANDVATSYYGVLRAQALRKIALEAVRSSQADLLDARKLSREGVILRESVLRAEVQAAEARQGARAATEEEFIALAALNLAIGLKGAGCVKVVEPPGIAELTCSLNGCLELAVRHRFEFQVARRSVEIASEGTKIARADFAPKVTADLHLFNIQQASPTIFADQLSGSIAMEWKLFEGGRRVASARVASSKLREAMAQVESLADNIAFQVNEAYRRSVTGRLGIEDARPAVDQSRENYRLVRARAVEGNATPAEIADALASATRSEQAYFNTLYSYLTAFARLEYAMGTAQTPPTIAPQPQPNPRR